MAHRNLLFRGHGLIFISALGLGLSGVGTRAGELAADEKAFLDQHYADVIKIEPVRIADPAVGKVFAAPFYTINLTIDGGDGSTISNSVIVARIAGKLASISRPSTDAIIRRSRPCSGRSLN